MHQSQTLLHRITSACIFPDSVLLLLRNCPSISSYMCFTFLIRILLWKFHFRITLLEYFTKPYMLSFAREKMPMVLHSGSLAAFLPQNQHLVRFRVCILTIVQYIIFCTFFRVSMVFVASG